jgi:glycosyltransferase involved in cell wall biosynthesis
VPAVRVVVASPLEAGSQWAHALNTIKMADGFARLGHEVTLVTRRDDGVERSMDELVDMYGLDPRLRWLQLKTTYAGIEVFRKGFPFSWRAYRTARSLKAELVYGRDFYFPWLCARAGINASAESHAPPGTNSTRFRTLVRATHFPKFRMWVTISEMLREYYAARGADASKIKVLPDAVDLSMFLRPADAGRSPFDGQRPNVVYAGHLYDYKGIPTILGAAQKLPQVDFHLVGGWPEDVERHSRDLSRRRIGNVRLHGLRRHSEVPMYLWHADVLLLPPSGTHPSAAWTSPVKLGEYLASGTPVVSTDIPALRTWLTGDETEFIEPDNPGAMATAITRLLADSSRRRSLSAKGVERARALSYEARAAAICRCLMH